MTFDWLLTVVQLFAVGVMVGLSGPCLIVCTPPLVLLFAGQQVPPRQLVVQLVSFLSGRVVTYSALGMAAGVSARWLERLTTPELAALGRPLGGILIIVLGLLTWFRSRRHACASRSASRPHDATSAASLFLLGLSMGLSPCPPLLAVFAEVVLAAKSWVQGLLMGAAFGLGSFVSGMVVLGAAAGLSAWLPGKVFSPGGRGAKVFQAGTAAALVAYGCWILWGGAS